MAEQDEPQDSAGPSLELPSLGFGRKKKRQQKRDRRTTEGAVPPPTNAVPAAPAPAAAGSAPAARVEPDPVDPVDPGPVRDPEPAGSSGPRPALPPLAPVPAAAATGLVVGLVVVGLVWASQGVCEVTRGTSSCGDAGFLLLLASLVVAGWLGGALLRGFGVADGGSTSFLALGLVAVVLLLFLGEQLFAWWMVVVVPVVAVTGFVVSQRITTTTVEPDGREMHR